MKTRSLSDRVRHALMFEVIGLMIIIPASAVLFNKPMTHMGVVGIGSATIATVWNFTFNIGFDRCMRQVYGHIRKSFKARLLHTVLFEAGLLLILLPLIAWYRPPGHHRGIVFPGGFAWNTCDDRIAQLQGLPFLIQTNCSQTSLHLRTGVHSCTGVRKTRRRSVRSGPLRLRPRLVASCVNWINQPATLCN